MSETLKLALEILGAIVVIWLVASVMVGALITHIWKD